MDPSQTRFHGDTSLMQSEGDRLASDINGSFQNMFANVTKFSRQIDHSRAMSLKNALQTINPHVNWDRDVKFKRVRTTLEGFRDENGEKKSTANIKDLVFVRDTLASEQHLADTDKDILNEIIDYHRISKDVVQAVDASMDKYLQNDYTVGGSVYSTPLTQSDHNGLRLLRGAIATLPRYSTGTKFAIKYYIPHLFPCLDMLDSRLSQPGNSVSGHIDSLRKQFTEIHHTNLTKSAAIDGYKIRTDHAYEAWLNHPATDHSHKEKTTNYLDTVIQGHAGSYIPDFDVQQSLRSLRYFTSDPNFSILSQRFDKTIKELHPNASFITNN